jgi:hypothetical protein
MNYLRAGRGDQHQWRSVRPKLSGAAVHFEGIRHFPSGFTGKEGMIEF